MQRLNLLGTPVDDVTYAEAAAYVSTLMAAGKPAAVVTPNPEFVVIAQRHAPFREALWQSDLAIPDGGGLLLAPGCSVSACASRYAAPTSPTS